MTRRRLITLLGGLATTPIVQPLIARADKTRRIGVLMAISSEDPEGKSRLAVFVQGLQKFGWTEGSNIHIEARFSGDDADLCRRYAEELVALAPDILFASTSESVAAFQRVTRSVPIVFASVIDPVGAGFVRSMARPGGNTTGFVLFEYSISGKWLELLKRLAPQNDAHRRPSRSRPRDWHWTTCCDPIRSLIFNLRVRKPIVSMGPSSGSARRWLKSEPRCLRARLGHGFG